MQSEDAVDPKKVAAQAISRMLVEFRKLKLALVLADQSPSRISADIIKATGTKFVGRTVELADRQIIGGAMLFNHLDFEQVARLRPGQVYSITEGDHRPRLIQMVKFHERLDLSSPVSWREFASCIADEAWLQDSRRRVETAWVSCLDHRVCQLDTKRREVIEALTRLSTPQTDGLAQRHAEVKKVVRKASDELTKLLADCRDAVADYCDLELHSPDLVAQRDAIRQRFETISEPDTDALIAKLKTMGELT